MSIVFQIEFGKEGLAIRVESLIPISQKKSKEEL
jgi:hypothetical protein